MVGKRLVRGRGFVTRGVLQKRAGLPTCTAACLALFAFAKAPERSAYGVEYCDTRHPRSRLPKYTLRETVPRIRAVSRVRNVVMARHL
jgi:hypothetical protein